MITIQELFTLEELAKWCNTTRGAVYQHYRRGHIYKVDMPCHRIYFTREQADRLRSLYYPNN